MRQSRLVMICALTGLGLMNCHSSSVSSVQSAAADILLPPAEERKLGDQIAAQVEQQTKILNDPVVTNYIREVGGRVAKASPNPDGWNFVFIALDDSKTVNAFAIPGGRIYVYSGLLRAGSDEAELAGVLAHEVAHVTSRHIAKRMVDQFGLETLASLALGGDPGAVEKIAAAMVVQGALLKNSRDDEAEADAKGVVASAKSGYDPKALVQFFETLRKSEGNTPEALTFLSDHPSSSSRISALNTEIEQKQLSGGQRNREAYLAVQKRVGGAMQIK